MNLQPATLAAVLAHAAREAPRECCGVIVDVEGAQQYYACRNVAQDGQQFEIHGLDFAAAEDAGRIVAIAHSHVGIPPIPSPADKAGCEASGLPWLIVNHPVGSHFMFEATGYRAPLLGRAFVHGVHDCWALVRDALMEEVGLTLPDFPRREGWDRGGEDLFEQHLAAAGFVKVSGELRKYDLLVMQIGADVPNHCALYLGEGVMLHHPMRTLSRRAVFGGHWAKCLRFAARHQTLCTPQP
jgi:proteasome lid subunit RPN8/RPN11